MKTASPSPGIASLLRETGYDIERDLEALLALLDV